MTAEDIPEFVYYEFLNWISCYYFIYAVIVSQFLAWFLGSVLFSFVQYRWWGVITLIMFGICLPVDVFIFFKEPFGAFGTLFATIWAVIPFCVMVADATFPEKEVTVVDK